MSVRDDGKWRAAGGGLDVDHRVEGYIYKLMLNFVVRESFGVVGCILLPANPMALCPAGTRMVE